MKQWKAIFPSRSFYRTISAVFLAVCLIMGVFSFQYYAQLQSAIRGEGNGYLQEISRRISNNVSRIIDDNYAALYSMAVFLNASEIETFSDVHPVLDAQSAYWDYEKILLIDKNGKAYDVNGKEVALNNDTYFDAVLNQKQSISTAQLIDNQECIMLMVPLENLTVDGKQFVGLAASYLPAVFEQTLSMTSFGGHAYSCVISETGTTVIRPTESSSLKFGYNVLSSISESDTDGSVDMAQVKSDLSQRKAGQIVFTQNDIRYYMVYMPLTLEGWHLLTFVPTKVVNERSDLLLSITLVLCGVVAMIFATLIAMLVYVFYRNKRKLEQIAYVDEITNGNTIQKFYQLAQDALDVTGHPQYALVYTNLQKFKVLNEQFGRRTCDTMLRMFHDTIAHWLKPKECIGRVSADNFCLLLEYTDESALVDLLVNWYVRAEDFVKETKPTWPLPVAEFGVFIIDNDTIPFPQIIDRAKLALREFPKMVNSKTRYSIYSDNAHQQLFREKQLEDMMEQSLQEGEFQVYLQPKYRLPEQKIGGAEALVRWANKAEGMIYPNDFIPLFEKNGFIVQLDLWMFEEVCKRLRLWLDQGLQPMKISVNCSRVHLNNPDFLRSYETIALKHNVPPELLEIELTESVVMQDSERLGKVIDDIHAAGFGCSMDDFGSGYSSLNLIQSIPVDTLKLDKIFFRGNSKDSARMESVVGSIVTMAKALSMDTVAEGVEYPEQVEMLVRVGCDYVQGFVFARPMPLNAFEQLAFGESKE